MNRFQQQLRFAVRTRLCPVCRRRERARWRDSGALRITCGDPACFLKWLPGTREVLSDPFPTLPTPSEEQAA